MFNQKKVARFMVVAGLTLGFLYLEKLTNNEKEECD